ncbi:RNA-binding protein [Lactobacillus taiwanensis]|uniref:CvfD/Ygs/GSP13 family RNA-binding post-transcriptional regulator n=1 Tax=Lactobacillus taiwanensis TaxID=508451 RepID=UPI000B981DC1|nr:CvfD/Ygs/GSP13 family RNA-binding post-transcriptional regulator [Lactobacillus taiwanensis]OYS00990.1 RNA-binding protein [Lactobacillus taiwanensis]OYS05332.1 RNA-binding protein [Lactobacillus taiwanensis]
MQVKIGDIVEGKISGIRQYGIFVRLDSKREGLIHISEIHGGYVKDIGREYQVGETIKVQVLDIDPYSNQISLSRRAVLPEVKEARKKRVHFWTSKRVKNGFSPLKEILNNQIKEAKERYSI